MWRDAYSRIVGQFNGHKALLQAAEQNRLERFFTFPNFAASADRCGQELRAAGLSEVAVESFPADGTTAWYGWRSMKAWDVTAARLWMTAPSAALGQKRPEYRCPQEHVPPAAQPRPPLRRLHSEVSDGKIGP